MPTIKDITLFCCFLKRLQLTHNRNLKLTKLEGGRGKVQWIWAMSILGLLFLWNGFSKAVVHYTPVHCTALHLSPHLHTQIHFTALHCTACHCTGLNCAMHCPSTLCVGVHYRDVQASCGNLITGWQTLQYTEPICIQQHCTVLHCTTLHRTALQNL